MINIMEIKINEKLLDDDNFINYLFNELNCAIFYIDLTSAKNLDNLKDFFLRLKNLEIIKDNMNNLTMLLVLNKSDIKEEIKITEEKINEFKNSNPFLDTIEISLENKTNINELTTKIYSAFSKKENLIYPSDNIKLFEKQYTEDLIEQYNIEEEGLINCILLGDSESGKSSLSLRYSKNEFSYSFISTIGIDKEIKLIKVNDKIYKFILWDTAGQERFRSLPTKYFQNAHGIFILFDVSKRESFDNVEKWMTDVNNNISKSKTTNVYLIGNKIDLEREVTKEEGNNMANKLGIKYFECSNKLNLNINDIMSNMILDCIKNFKNDNTNKGTQLKSERKNKKSKKCCK